jgi:hypothetical protein
MVVVPNRKLDGMKERRINWVFLSMVSIIAVIFMAQAFLPPPKIRARRIQTVNNLSKISFIVTNSNASLVPGTGP